MDWVINMMLLLYKEDKMLDYILRFMLLKLICVVIVEIKYYSVFRNEIDYVV